ILHKITIQLLSETSISFGCDHNWSVFERVHIDRMNKLGYFVFVNYNLNLKNILCDICVIFIISLICSIDV
ncbi:hypothetical protein LINPERPRIM_LOCUS6055, partial [Linum perenne]